MGTMTSSSASSKLFTSKFRAKTFCSSRLSDVDKFPEIRFFRFEKLAAASCANLSNFSLRPVSSLFSSSQPQVEFEPAETEVPEQYEFPTVHFKFQLQRQCEFGEQFFIVGSDSVLGLWNPVDAIPMSWSDGHVWTAELDIPIGKSIKFKFILRKRLGRSYGSRAQTESFIHWKQRKQSMFLKIGRMQNSSK
ncbi:hypothetical protein Nepgr_030966 [Nepenthes gracilis]|uniref:CBM20 domain-containing protein n=1 Tax=Nepenthes gracilis TaxID=150966 RepID=A0AAD3THK1_NEPGR|nr:hypothetical protein Nepgr_030966 [Nepenthes gracilis]